MKSRLLILCLFFLGTGCKNKDRIPGNILPPSKMQAVLWDMMRADQFFTDFRLNKDTSLDIQEESIKMYRQIFNIHAISKEQFQQSFSFYQSHPAFLKEIMDSMSKPDTAIQYGKSKDSVLKADSPATFSLKDTSRRRLKKKIRSLNK